MSDERSAARTKLDFVYQEVVGEVTALVTRIEDANKRLTAVGKKMDAAAVSIDKLPDRLQTALAASGKEISHDLAARAHDAVQASESHLAELARQSARYATIAHQSARRMALIALIVGSAAGSIGGLLAGVALGGHLG
ncbi:hypothetical protein [Castellaniella denitrificans]|uniref:StbC n=1 Tax=Castellaniella denitrificans TaxID=56119 RepID=A0ABT4LZN1_9BURK|nr:hypothetical protein [Castellaniella denitrificans]MCZ4328501.1 hypothetical protein [Castellaniella denitrificans]